MAGTIRPDDMDVSTTPTMSNATLPGLDGSTSAKKPSAPRTPRIDVEPLYAAVKGAITDAEWTTYKTSLSAFLLGNLNQDELSFKLSRILRTPALEHAHNALVTAMYGNIWRDAPEAGIASWVSSSDKPSSGTAKGQGDESEKRLKYEVMQLSRRERKRLKTIPPADVPMPEGVGALGSVGPTLEYVEARRVKQPEMGPTSTQGGYKTSRLLPHHLGCASSAPLTIHDPLIVCPILTNTHRLGPRNPQTLHLRTLRRNARISHRNHNFPPSPPNLLRVRSATRSHPRLPRLPQPRN
jgi:hypothetical protein